VLTPQGAQRIGLETARVAKVAGPAVTIPLGAIIYDPSGRTYAFVASGRLTYREVPVSVDRIDGNLAYLRKGPHAGARVVSTGAEELYGVQTGVLGQT
jgi:multidrug efflux pump subunit AcrA (membrane-fusion protein)